jgi:hypothetical protein
MPHGDEKGGLRAAKGLCRRLAPHIAARYSAFWIAAAAAAGCTTSYPVVGSFDNYNEVFRGEVHANPAVGESFIEVKGKNSGVKCIGGSRIIHVPASNRIVGLFLIPYCKGQKGYAHLECDDGREITATFTTETCTSGYGDGHDQRGGRFRFTFGMIVSQGVV